MHLENLLRGFSIRTRMLGAIGVVLLLLCAVGGVGLVGLRQVVTMSEASAVNTMAEARELMTLVQAMGELRRFEKDMVVNHAMPEQVKAYRARWEQAGNTVHAAIRRMLEGEEDVDNPILRQLDGEITAYADAAAKAFVPLEAGQVRSIAAAIDALATAEKMAQTAEKRVEALQAALQQESEITRAENQATERRMMLLSALALALAVVVVVPLTLLNMVSICRPIEQAENLARLIARGELDRPVRAEGRDEASRLVESLEAMRQWLSQIVGEVRRTADSIQTASAEVASGNTDLSQRTEQAASSLQLTASSVEQLAANVRQNADAAAQANQLASSASVAAHRGGEVVHQVVANMDDISASSRRIGDIIGTIDGIAFQTNILALNAAVEAARAGEQGRGFAVVAGEVRSLAQRSAEAAREIKSLIGASVEKVESGSRLVKEAGASMGEIVAGVQRVTDIIGEISAATGEQSGGIGQVNQAVSQLDQMTQQNAALVEESAAAAESLREQAERLARTVATFRVGGQGAGADPSAVPAPAAALPPKSLPAAPRPAPSAPVPTLTAAVAPAPAPAELAERVIARARSAPAAHPSPRADDGDWESF